jgi:uncharacterized protein YlxW (UPF0749 family)
MLGYLSPRIIESIFEAKHAENLTIGILEKIAGKQAQLKDAKLSDQKKEQIRKEIDALNSEAEKLRAEIADFEEGVKDTRRIESEVYDKLQSAKKDAA